MLVLRSSGGGADEAAQERHIHKRDRAHDTATCHESSCWEHRQLVLRIGGTQAARNLMSFPIQSDEQGAGEDVPEAPVSATVPDWSREACSTFDGNPSRQLLAAVRAYQRWRELPGF